MSEGRPIGRLLDEYQYVRQLPMPQCKRRAEELLGELSEHLSDDVIRRLRSARSHVRAIKGRSELDDVCASIRTQLVEVV